MKTSSLQEKSPPVGGPAAILCDQKNETRSTPVTPSGDGGDAGDVCSESLSESIASDPIQPRRAKTIYNDYVVWKICGNEEFRSCKAAPLLTSHVNWAFQP
jgi:hypothetical protein